MKIMNLRKSIFVLLLAAGAVFAAGCGEKKTGDRTESEREREALSPREVCEELAWNLKRCDFATAAGFCDGKMKELFEKWAEKYSSADEKEREDVRRAEEEHFRNVRFGSEKIEGDSAAVEIIITESAAGRKGNERRETQHLKRIRGRWKCIFDTDRAVAKKYIKVCQDDEIAARELVSGMELKSEAIRDAKFGDPIIKDDKAVVLLTNEECHEVTLEKVDGKWKVKSVGSPRNLDDSAVADEEDARQLIREGQAYFNGDGGKTRNYRKARECFVKAKARGAKHADFWIKQCDKKLTTPEKRK